MQTRKGYISGEGRTGKRGTAQRADMEVTDAGGASRRSTEPSLGVPAQHLESGYQVQLRRFKSPTVCETLKKGLGKP